MTRHNFRISLLVLFLAAFGVGLPIASATGCGSVPAGLVACNPLTITTGTNPLPTNTEINVIVNTLAGSTYINTALDNWGIYNTISGAWVTNAAWVETANTANTLQYNGLSSSLQLWFRIPSQIAGSTTYNGFALGAISTASNVPLPSVIGFAPELSCASGCAQSSYGQYDDGAQVFNTLYENFTGTSVPSIFSTSGSGYSINNGLLITGASESYLTTLNTYGLTTNSILEFFGNMPSTGTNNNEGWGFGAADIITLAKQFDFALQYTILQVCDTSTCHNTAQSTPFGFNTLSLYFAPSNGIAYFNYAPIFTTSSPPVITSNVYIYSASSGMPPFTTYWMRIRNVPISLNYPSISQGGWETSSSTSLSINPSNVVYEQPSTITTTCSAGDTCLITTPANVVLASGITSATYTYCAGQNTETCNTPSIIVFNGVDSTLGQNTLGTLTISKAPQILALNNCTNQAWTSPAVGYACTTKGSYTTENTLDALSQLTTKMWLTAQLDGTTTTSLVGSTNSISNVVSSLVTNAINYFSFTFNSPGNGNFLSNSYTVNWIGYTPLTVTNALSSFTVAPNWNAISSASNSIPQTFPYALTTPPVGGSVTYSLSNSVNAVGTSYGSFLARVSNSASLAFTENPSNVITGNYDFRIAEFQAGNMVLINQTFIPLNSVVLTAQPSTGYTTSNGLIQYFPIYLTNSLMFTSLPTSIIVDGYPYSSSAGVNISKGSNTTTLPLNIQVTYPFQTFNLTYKTGQTVNSLTLSNFCITPANSVPSAPCTREIINVTTYNQKSSVKIPTSTSAILTGLFNGHIIQNTTAAFSANNFQVYIPSSSFANPNLALTSITLSSAALTLSSTVINNYCPTSLNSSSYMTLSPYLIDANGSLYAVSISSGYSGGGIGDFIHVLDGISNASSIVVQQYKITQNPFALPLENGGSYAFKLLDGNCKFVYSTNFSVQGNPITIKIPINQSVPSIAIPNITASCQSTPTGNTIMIACSGNDRNDIISLWNLTVYGISPLGSGWIPENSVQVSATEFTYDFFNRTDSNATRVIVTARGPGISLPYIFDFNTGVIQVGFSLVARAFITLLFMLCGLGIGVSADKAGAIGDEHLASTTIVMVDVMLVLSYLLGISTFIPLPGAIGLMIFLIFIAIMTHRHESGLGGP